MIPDPSPLVRCAVTLLLRAIDPQAPTSPVYDPRVGRAVAPQTEPAALLREAQQVIEAALGAGWQPIETAPQDADVLVYCEGEIGVARFHTYANKPGGWWQWDSEYWPPPDEGFKPSRWRPVPAPPEPAEEQHHGR